MFDNPTIQEELLKTKTRSKNVQDQLVSEARKILQKDLFTEKKILDNLRQYEKSFEVLDEENLDENLIFSLEEVKKTAVRHRLKFLDSGLYKNEIPYEAILKIKDLETRHGKSLRYFKVLGHPQVFSKHQASDQCSLFARTNYGNYFFVHAWGKPLSWKRRVLYTPMRTFESLALTVLCVTLCITLLLPTFLITLDSHASYWSGYRAATFFHLLFFNFGITAYFTFAFTLNFNSSIWNKRKDFD